MRPCLRNRSIQRSFKTKNRRHIKRKSKLWSKRKKPKWKIIKNKIKTQKRKHRKGRNCRRQENCWTRYKLRGKGIRNRVNKKPWIRKYRRSQLLGGPIQGGTLLSDANGDPSSSDQEKS